MLSIQILVRQTHTFSIYCMSGYAQEKYACVQKWVLGTHHCLHTLKHCLMNRLKQPWGYFRTINSPVVFPNSKIMPKSEHNVYSTKIL